MCRNERLLIGGDWNANVERGSAKNGVSGDFGVGIMNYAGRDLIEWCEANGLVYAIVLQGILKGIRGSIGCMAGGTSWMGLW